MKHIFFSILTALAFWHCQNSTPAAKNTLNCYVRFDAAGRTIKAEAFARDAASKQVVEIPGGLRFQATEMKVLPVRGITYSVEFSAKYTPETTFDWQNKKGEKGSFKLDMPLIDSFFFDKKILSTKHSSIMKWGGKALQKGETIVFIWENAEEGKTIPMEVSTTLGSPLIEIPAAKISQVGRGTWSLYLVRKHIAKSEVDDFIVESTAEYYTKSITIQIED